MDALQERVFVSSTVYDLLDLRAELAAHLRDLGVEPLLAEHAEFGARSDETAIELCLRRIDDAEIVFVIIDARYGEPLADYENKSATQVELEYAQAIGKQPHVFVRDRVMAAFEIWRKHDKKPGDYWPVRAEDAERLFPWIEQLDREKRWFSQFRDSIDLKRRVEKLLERQASRAALARGLRDGSIPIVLASIRFADDTPLARGELDNTARFIVNTFNFGQQPILDVTLALMRDPSLQATSYQAPGSRPSFEYKHFMSRGQTLPPTGDLRIEYTTLNGIRVASVLCCHFGVPSLARRESMSIVSHKTFELL